jgi:N-acetylneuraminate synthase/N,N'-diacetyllegionaminate synthase
VSDPVLFVIPARGGSRRVPRKNLRPVAGIPLVAGAVRIARRAAASIPGGPHPVVCSTDDPDIAAVAAAWGARVPFVRPPLLADDAATSVDVVLHALDHLAGEGLRFRAVVMVQPTSPLTDPDDIRAAVARFDTDRIGIVSVTRSHPASWHQVLEEGSGRLTAAAGDAARYLLSGAFYVAEPGALAAARRFVEPGRTRGFVVPPERSIDVDEELELDVAEAIAVSRAVTPVPLGRRSIGVGRCCILAAVGGNHNGEPTLARRLVDAAADAGADAVAIGAVDESRPDVGPRPRDERPRGGRDDGRQESPEQPVLSPDTLTALASQAADRGLALLAGPLRRGSAGLLKRPGPAALWVASTELEDPRFLARLAGRGMPLLVSTGETDILTVANAVDAIRAAGGPPLALLLGGAADPARPGGGLRVMRSVRAAFGVPVGWSDHAPGIPLASAAAAIGADILEEPLTLDRGLPGPGHAASLDPVQLAGVVAAVRAVEDALGLDISPIDRGGGT